MSALITTIGITATVTTRLSLDVSGREIEIADAELLARSAVEHALAVTVKDERWRQTFQHGVAGTSFELEAGSYSWTFSDPVDGDLSDNADDPVVILGSATAGDAVRSYETIFSPNLTLRSLRYTLHADGRIKVLANATLTTTGARVSTNKKLHLDSGSALDGDAECGSTSSPERVTGTLIEDARPKRAARQDLFDRYVAIATELPFAGDLQKQVLTPTVNTYGSGLNPDGVYYIRTGGASVLIKACRIEGTLVIDAGSGTVKVEDAAFIECHRTGYPTLLVRGDLKLDLESSSRQLIEAEWSTNFNPSGAAYISAVDADTLDAYPNEIRGLVHVIGDLTMFRSTRVVGVVLVEERVDCSASSEIELIYAWPGEGSNPPWGYTTRGLDQWRRVVEQ
jgi:hypothetical protein